ncbi:hypothetical protein S83_004846, partial [Arachis hypogaea]
KAASTLTFNHSFGGALHTTGENNSGNQPKSVEIKSRRGRRFCHYLSLSRPHRKIIIFADLRRSLSISLFAVLPS